MMANRKLFSSKGAGVPVATTVNKAGGKAYAFGEEHTLAQGIVTSFFGSTFYMTEGEQLDAILGLAQKCEPMFVAKAAVYGHEHGKMKDTPALMLAVLAARAKTEPEAARAFALAFPRIATRFKMVQNFVQIVRSGKTGRRSFGSLPKRMLRQWLADRTGNALFTGSIGSDPSFSDVVKMVHPKPDSEEKKALYAYFIGRDYSFDELPSKVREYEQFKKGLLGNDQSILETHQRAVVPNIPFQMLASLPLKDSHWREIILNMPWNALRMNLNTAARHGAFNDKAVIDHVARVLSDPNEVRRNNAFPYQLLTTFQNVGPEVPAKVRLALQDAMEIATENVPVFDDGVAICVDISGSMGSVVTGHRKGATSVTRYVDISALVGASIARRNPDALVIPFNHGTHYPNSLNPRDSIMTNASKLAAMLSGGTDVGAPMRLLNGLAANRPKTVIFVSDNESWFNPIGRSYYGGTGLAHEWEIYKKKTKGARLVCIDISPNGTSQIVDGGTVLNIGGFSDKVWPLIQKFIQQGDTNFIKLINDTIDLQDVVYGSDENFPGEEVE